MEEDQMTGAEREEYEEYVLQSLRDAGADTHAFDSSTLLEDLEQDILEDATRQLRYDFDASFKQQSKMTISALAEELWRAVKSR
ncbi:hypothetical protein D3C76_617050 [compost metagenome]